MITIIHGEDTAASYNYLGSLLKNYPNHQRIYLEEDSTLDDLNGHLNTQNIFAKEEVIICRNFISDKKIKIADLKRIYSSKTLILLEKQKVNTPQTNHLEKISIMEFKLPATLFHFLDSITPGSIIPLTYLKKIKDKSALNWHLTYRLLLLILASRGFSREDAEAIANKPIVSWQWQKITRQAEGFDKDLLRTMYNATLALDLMKKQGKTQTADHDLITLLLIKYLKPLQVIQ